MKEYTFTQNNNGEEEEEDNYPTKNRSKLRKVNVCLTNDNIH